MPDLIQYLLSLVENYGYLGAFIGSLLGNITIALPTPYAFLISALGSTLNPFILGLVCGIGSTLGEVLSYSIGYASRSALNDKQKERLLIVKQLIEKYGAWVIILFAITPLPDDIILVPMGMIKYDAKKVISSLLIGKTILTLFLAYAGHYGIEFLGKVFTSSGWYGVFLSLLLLLVVIILMLKIDWEKMIEKL